MDQRRRVQVVLGEAERTDGLLRFVLEAEGFDIIGLASDDQELERVLRGARPAVIVLDGGISVAAALQARRRGAALVVVWPDGVSAVIAEERVDPYEAIADLGDAVRRAVDRAELGDEAERRETRIRIPDAPDVAPTIVDGRTRKERPGPTRSRGRHAHLLVAAATWMLVLTALTTIAIAVPNALGLFPGRGGARPSLGSVTRRSSDPLPDVKVTDPRRTGDSQPSANCDATAVRANGCPSDHGQRKEGTTNKDRGAGGRHNDPGSKSNKKQKPHGGHGGHGSHGGNDGTRESGGTVVEPGNGGDPGDARSSRGSGKVKEHPHTGNSDRSGHGNAG